MGVAAQRARFSLTTFASFLFALSLAVKLGTTLWLKHLNGLRDYSEHTITQGSETRPYSRHRNATPAYIGDDHPHEWPIDRPYVRMAASHTVRWQLDDDPEWRANVPGDGDGVVYLGAQRQPYTLAMLHQLRCLDVVRGEVVRPRREGGADADGPSELARHCLNYIRQMVICRGDTQLEPFEHPNNIDPIFTDQVYECRDWDAVYRKVKENQEEYRRWLETREQA